MKIGTVPILCLIADIKPAATFWKFSHSGIPMPHGPLGEGRVSSAVRRRPNGARYNEDKLRGAQSRLVGMSFR